MTCARQDRCKHGDGCFVASDYDVARCTAFKSKVQTNEEWIKQCTTEQLADFLNDCRFYFDGLKIVSAKYQDMEIEDIPLEWLKQPHKE